MASGMNATVNGFLQRNGLRCYAWVFEPRDNEPLEEAMFRMSYDIRPDGADWIGPLRRLILERDITVVYHPGGSRTRMRKRVYMVSILQCRPEEDERFSEFQRSLKRKQLKYITVC